MEKQIDEAEFNSVRDEIKHLREKLNNSLVDQAGKFTVQDNILATLIEIKTAIKNSESEIKHAIRNIRTELEVKEKQLVKRIEKIEESVVIAKTVMRVIKVQWGIIIIIAGTILTLIGFHLQKLL